MKLSNAKYYSKNIEVMNFLNEISLEYPNAISFASGRPTDKYFDIPSWIEKIPIFTEYFSSKKDISIKRGSSLIGQYGRTNGIINDLISEQLKNDEGIHCDPEQIIVTSGCQEAMTICLKTLLTDERDVLLVFNPSYIGITGVAEILGMQLSHIVIEGANSLIDSVASAVERNESSGRCVKGLYLVADFNNPTGEVLPEQQRKELVDFCSGRRILILEDNAYGMFRYEGAAQKSLYSIDTLGTVLYLGTYSKTLCPSLRVGFIVLPKLLFNERKSSEKLSKSLSIAKSFITLNTSQISQAIVGGILLTEGMSLKKLTASPIAYYKNNRDCMIDAFQTEFSRLDSSISWNRPEGGFFITMKLPFDFDDKDVKICGELYGVLCMPMSFFAFDNQYNNQIRLAFSNVENDKIVEGVHNLADYFRAKLEI